MRGSCPSDEHNIDSVTCRFECSGVTGGPSAVWHLSHVQRFSPRVDSHGESARLRAPRRRSDFGPKSNTSAAFSKHVATESVEAQVSTRNHVPPIQPDRAIQDTAGQAKQLTPCPAANMFQKKQAADASRTALPSVRSCGFGLPIGPLSGDGTLTAIVRTAGYRCASSAFGEVRRDNHRQHFGR